MNDTSDIKEPTNPSTILTFISWYTQSAVYLGDELIYYGDHPGGNRSLLQALGFTVRHGDCEDIPTHDIPCEYTVDDRGWWLPPPSLILLKGQQAALRERLRREEIARLEQRLAFLKADGNY